MSNDLAMTMDELEAESAELLPSRETLCVSRWGHSHGGNSFTASARRTAHSRFGLLNISLLNGDFNSLL